MNENPDPIQQPSGTLLSPVCLLHNNPDEKRKTVVEVETNANDDRNRFLSDSQREYDWSEFLVLVEAIYSDDHFKQYSGLIGIRRLLSNFALCISSLISVL